MEKKYKIKRSIAALISGAKSKNYPLCKLRKTQGINREYWQSCETQERLSHEPTIFSLDSSHDRSTTCQLSINYSGEWKVKSLAIEY